LVPGLEFAAHGAKAAKALLKISSERSAQQIDESPLILATSPLQLNLCDSAPTTQALVNSQAIAQKGQPKWAQSTRD
jgi:hypothetical protein